MNAGWSGAGGAGTQSFGHEGGGQLTSQPPQVPPSGATSTTDMSKAVVGVALGVAAAAVPQLAIPAIIIGMGIAAPSDTSAAPADLLAMASVASGLSGLSGGAALADDLVGPTGGAAGDHIVLGLKAYGLERTATQVGGRTLMNDVNWQTTLQAAVGSPSTRFTVALDGVTGTSPYSKFMGAAQRGLTPGATPFNWEMGQLFQSGRHLDATFIESGQILIVPFK